MRASRWFKGQQSRGAGVFIPKIATLSSTGPHLEAHVTSRASGPKELILAGVTVITGKEVAGK